MALLEKNTSSCGAMDQDRIKKSLDQTISFKDTERKQAQRFLKDLEESPGFTYALIDISIDKTEENLQRRLSAIIYLKNIVRANWKCIGQEDDNKCAAALALERENLRSVALETLLVCDHAKVRPHLAEAVREMAARDRGGGGGSGGAPWAGLPAALAAALRRVDLDGANKENSEGAVVPVGNLLTALCAVLKPYRFAAPAGSAAAAAAEAELDALAAAALPLWAAEEEGSGGGGGGGGLFPALVDQALAAPGDAAATEPLRLATMALYRATRAGRLPAPLAPPPPPAAAAGAGGGAGAAGGALFGGALPRLVPVLRALLLGGPAAAAAAAPGEGKEEEEGEEPNPDAPEWKLARRILKLVLSLQARQRPGVAPLMPELVEIAWAALAPASEGGPGRRLPDRVLGLALDLLGRAADDAALKGDLLARAREGFARRLFPLFCFGAADREIWADDPDEYVARNLDLELDGVVDAAFREDRYSARRSALALAAQLAAEEALRERELAAAAAAEKKGKKGRGGGKRGGGKRGKRGADGALGATAAMVGALLAEWADAKGALAAALAAGAGEAEEGGGGGLAALQEGRLCGAALGLGTLAAFAWPKQGKALERFVREEVLAPGHRGGYDLRQGGGGARGPLRSPFVTAHLMWLAYQALGEEAEVGKSLGAALNQQVMDAALDCMNTRDEDDEDEEEEEGVGEGDGGDGDGDAVSLTDLGLGFGEGGAARSWKPARVAAGHALHRLLASRYEREQLGLVLAPLVERLLAAARAEHEAGEDGAGPAACAGLPMRVFHLVVETGEEDLLPYMRRIGLLMAAQAAAQARAGEDTTASVALEALALLVGTLDEMWEPGDDDDDEEEEDEEGEEEEEDGEEEEEDGAAAAATPFQFGATREDTVKKVGAGLAAGAARVLGALWGGGNAAAAADAPAYSPEAVTLFTFLLKRGTGAPPVELALAFLGRYSAWIGTCELECASECGLAMAEVAKAPWGDADAAVIRQKLADLVTQALEAQDARGLGQASLGLRVSLAADRARWGAGAALAAADALAGALREVEEGPLRWGAAAAWCHCAAAAGAAEAARRAGAAGQANALAEALTEICQEPQVDNLGDASRAAVVAAGLALIEAEGGATGGADGRRLGALFEELFALAQYLQSLTAEDDDEANEDEDDDDEEEDEDDDDEDDEEEEEEEETEEQFLARYEAAAKGLENDEDEETAEWDDTDCSLDEFWHSQNIFQAFVAWCEARGGGEGLAAGSLVRRARRAEWLEEYAALRAATLGEGEGGGC